MSRKKKTQVQPDLWGDAIEAPRADVADPVKVARKRAALKALIWAQLLSWPVLALAVVGLLLDGGSSPSGPTGTVVAATSSSETLAKSVAMQTVSKWLDSEPSPLPGGQLLFVESVVKTDVKSGSTNASPGPLDPKSLSVVSLVLSGGDGQLYRSAVPVAVADDATASAIEVPSLELIAARRASDSQEAWPGRDTINASDEVSMAASQWALAFASGDSDTLRLAVGDTAADHFYQPMPQMQQVKVSLKGASELKKPVENQPGSQVIIVRAQLTYLWAGQPADKTNSAAFTAMDLLVERADTAAPLVTAWGAPGTGPSLVRYGNAIAMADREPVKPSTMPTVPSSPSPKK